MESETQIVRAILRQNEFLFRRHLVLSRTVLDQMKESGLITDVTRRKILTQPTYRQAAILLNSLENKGLLSLKKFLDVLRGTGHGWMVDHVLDTDVTADGQGRSKDDSSNRFQPANARTHAYPADSDRRRRHDMLRPDLRKTVTAGVTGYDGQLDRGGLSLGALLKAREPPDPSTAPRGVINARTLLTDTTAGGTAYPTLSGPLSIQVPGSQLYNQQSISYPRTHADIPMTLYGLNQAFSDEDQKNQQALSILRQEEIAIRQLMEQNARDQGNVRRKQAAVHDIVTRLGDIHNRAKEVYEPSPNPNIGRYRLAQLNQIPWSIDG